MSLRSDHAARRLTALEASSAVQGGRIMPLFQPIEDLQTGACRGFEALARLRHDERLVKPDDFLASLNADDRLCLFGVMLGEGIALLKRGGATTKHLYVSINVEISLIMDEDFVDILLYYLERYDFSGQRLVLEVLEGEDVVDFGALARNLEAIRHLGFSIALDDVGSAYASLAKIRDLPIDIFKLDRSFSRDLEMHPEDLMFVLSILSLARGLGKSMIVEGIETAEVYDALRVMGVELGQGYGICPPIPAEDVAEWLAERTLHTPDRHPTCLLGAYASQLTVIETCRALARQPLPIAWTDHAMDHVNCVVGKLFTARGWHHTAFGEAHRLFHQVLPLYDEDAAKWTEAAERFRDLMALAISERPHEMRCEPVAASGAVTPRATPAHAGKAHAPQRAASR